MWASGTGTPIRKTYTFSKLCTYNTVHSYDTILSFWTANYRTWSQFLWSEFPGKAIFRWRTLISSTYVQYLGCYISRCMDQAITLVLPNIIKIQFRIMTHQGYCCAQFTALDRPRSSAPRELCLVHHVYPSPLRLRNPTSIPSHGSKIAPVEWGTKIMQMLQTAFVSRHKTHPCLVF